MSAASQAESELVPHALPEGVVLFERYRVHSKVAEGAAAAVYEAEDLSTTTRVALKVFDPLRGADPIARARFAREFQVLVALNHPGVARALRFEEGPYFDVLVMELVEGESLRQRMERGRFDWPEASELALYLAQALEACHAAGVVHRDLKPENIVLHPDRGPVILDFGVAWFSSAMTLTQTGALLGSPRYLAPELFESPDVDARADIFSLGAIIYEGLAGRPVRLVDNMAELAARVGPDAPPALTSLRPDLPVAVWALLQRALAHRPEHRYATAQEFEAALRGTAGQFGRQLEARLKCSTCGLPLVIDLPMCPGCGAQADWSLEPGPFAVQIHEVQRPAEAAGWLQRRYPNNLVSHRWLQRRLKNPPVPLVIGVSESSAESLASQAMQAGCRAEVLRGRILIGPALRVPTAAPAEILGAAATHLAVVLGAGVLLTFAGVSGGLTLLPAAVGAVGVVAATRYARRALLKVDKAESWSQNADLEAVRTILGALKTERGRRLAATAVARATPVLICDAQGLPEGAAQDVQEALRHALKRATEVDAYQHALTQRPRARLRAELAAAEKTSSNKVSRLKAELETLTEAALSHDLAVRRTLQACREISLALSTRVLASDED